MTERTLTERLMDRLEAAFRGSVVLKYNDRSTGHIPDLSIEAYARICRIEVKYQRAGRTLKQITKAGQVVLCHQLYTVSNGRCWFVVYHERPKGTSIWLPRAMAAQVMPHTVLGAAPELWKKGPHGVGAEDYINLATLRGLGSIFVPGMWDHDMVVKIVKESFAC